MRQFVSRPNIVRAAGIVSVSPEVDEYGQRLIVIEGYEGIVTYTLSAEQQARMVPVLGDYLVFAPQPTDSDPKATYDYLNPKAIFEAKYDEVGLNATNNQMNPSEKWKDAGQVAVNSPVSIPKPSQGRVVIYHHPGSADGRFPPRTSPAIVREVDPDNPYRCQIFVFGPLGQHQDWVDFGGGPSQWTWPSRV